MKLTTKQTDKLMNLQLPDSRDPIDIISEVDVKELQRYACVVGGGVEGFADGELVMFADANAEIQRLTRELEEAKLSAFIAQQDLAHANTVIEADRETWKQRLASLAQGDVPDSLADRLNQVITSITNNDYVGDEDGEEITGNCVHHAELEELECIAAELDSLATQPADITGQRGGCEDCGAIVGSPHACGQLGYATDTASGPAPPTTGHGVPAAWMYRYGAEGWKPLFSLDDPRTSSTAVRDAQPLYLHPATPEKVGVPTLDVWFGSMPESNGKTNWTAILHAGDFTDGFTIARSEYKDRVRYNADCVKHLIGRLETRPCISDYDGDLLAKPPTTASGAEADTPTNRERAAKEVASWPQWKRDVMLTKFSAPMAEKGSSE